MEKPILNDKLPLSESHIHILLHALGFQKRAGKWNEGGWRNYYNTGVDCDTFEDCQELERGGWMQGHNRHGDEWTFRVSLAGIAAIRLAGWKFQSDESDG